MQDLSTLQAAWAWFQESVLSSSGHHKAASRRTYEQNIELAYMAGAAGAAAVIHGGTEPKQVILEAQERSFEILGVKS